MTRSRSLRVLVFVAMVALFACCQLAVAQEKPHFQIKVVPKMNSDVPQPGAARQPVWARTGVHRDPLPGPGEL
jgi:hypothetical protein